jgi:uncharacterized protein (DUF111 family)
LEVTWFQLTTIILIPGMMILIGFFIRLWMKSLQDNKKLKDTHREQELSRIETTVKDMRDEVIKKIEQVVSKEYVDLEIMKLKMKLNLNPEE